MAEYLTYWKHATAVQNSGAEMDHAASDQFGKVRHGDVLWFVTWVDGTIYLLSRMEVDRVVTQREASRALGTSDLWEATHHVLPKPGTVSRVSFLSLREVAPHLRFQGGVDRLPTPYTVQSFRTMRWLTVESAALLGELWNGAWPELPVAPRPVPLQTPKNDRAPRKPKMVTSGELRRLVEKHAMSTAIGHYEREGFAVEDTSMSHPYDLRCTRSGRVLYVEVKGTRSRGTSVNVTKNEVNFAQENKDNMVLFIVHSIEVEEHNRSFKACRGTVVIHQPWDVSAGLLIATSYVYSP